MKHPNSVYRGERVENARGAFVGVRVTADGKPLAMPDGLDLAAGYEWSYCGAGPLRLSLAILYHATGDRRLAYRASRWFLFATIACWGSSWQITAAEIAAWLRQWERETQLDGDGETDAPVFAKGGAA